MPPTPSPVNDTPHPADDRTDAGPIEPAANAADAPPRVVDPRADEVDDGRFYFPGWVNSLLIPASIGGALLGAYVLGTVYYGASPENLLTGYQPDQPVPFSHALHSGQMKIDCRYCHTGVTVAAHSNLPATATCANCHNGQQENGVNLKVAVHTDKATLAPVRNSIETGEPIRWNRIHDLPDYAYFNHSAHVRRGVSCVSCHGRVDKMVVVQRVEPLNMGWCVECHRNPDERLRPPELITNLAWDWDEQSLEDYAELFRETYGMDVAGKDPEVVQAEWVADWREKRQIHPSTDCSTCHR